MSNVLEISKNSFHCLLVRNNGVGHKLTHIVNRIGYIRTSERKVLKISNSTVIKNEIIKERTICERQFDRGRHRESDWLRFIHMSFL